MKSVNEVKILDAEFISSLVDTTRLLTGYSEKFEMSNPYVPEEGLVIKLFLFSNFFIFRDYCVALGANYGSDNGTTIETWKKNSTETLHSVFAMDGIPFRRVSAESLSYDFFWIHVDFETYGDCSNGKMEDVWLVSKKDKMLWLRDTDREVLEDSKVPIWKAIGEFNPKDPNFIDKLRTVMFGTKEENE